jgi:deoxycytidylate deaminase
MIEILKIKSFSKCLEESTCKKRKVVCELYDIDGNLLIRESNRCSPNNGICCRLNINQDKNNYDAESSCNWIHAEINAINNLQIGLIPFKAVVYGHSFFCDNCEKELRKIGVVEFIVKENENT